MHRYARLSLAAASPVWLACGLLVAQESPTTTTVSFRNVAQPDKDYIGDPLSPQAVMRFGTLRFLHPSTVAEMGLSPDEQTVVTLDGSVLISWDAATGQELWRQEWRSLGGHIIGPAYGQRYLDFGTDSSRFYTTGKSNKIHVWGSRDGSHDVISLETNLLAGLFAGGSNSSFASLDVNQDATLFITGSDKEIKLYNRKGKQLWSLANKPAEPMEIGGGNRDRLRFGGHYSTGIFSTDEKLVACVLSQAPKQISLLDAMTGEEKSAITLRDNLVRMTFARDGRSIVATERDCATRCYSIETRQLNWEHVLAPDPKNAESYTSAVDCSTDGKLVAVGAPIGPNNLIYLLDASTGKEVTVMRGHAWKPWAVKFTKDSQTLYSTGWDAAVRRWNVSRAEQMPLPQGLRGSDVVTISRDGKQIAFADGGGVVHVLDAASGSESRQISPAELGCSVLRFSPDGKTLYSGGQSRASKAAEDDGQEFVGIQAWDLSTGKSLSYWQWPRGNDPHSDIEALAMSPDNRFAAAAVFRQHNAYVWDIEQDKQIAVLKHQNIYGLDISRDSQAVATVGWDSMLRLWEIGTGKLISQVAVADVLKDQVQGGDLRMYGVKFSPDGKHLAAVHMDGKVSVWDVTEHKHPAVEHFFSFESRFIYGAIDYSPDGLWLALGGSDGTVKLFDAHLGVSMWTVGKHPEHVYTVAFGADSRTLVSGGGGISYAWNLVPQLDSHNDKLKSNGSTTIETEADLAAAWKSLDSDQPELAYRAIWDLANSPSAAEYLENRIMQVQTVLDPKAITQGQSEVEARRRLELAVKARQKDNKIEFARVVHRALIACRLSKSPDAPKLLEQLYTQHPGEKVRELVARVQ